MNSQSVNELINILEQEARIYSEILKISKTKTNIIVEGKVAELERIVKLEQALVLEMAKLEDQRERLVGGISSELGVETEKLTITNLIKYTGKEQGEILKKQQEILAGVVKELNSANELNSKLIKNSLDYINFSMNLFANAGSTDNNYSASGEKPTGKERTLFDFKV